LKKRKGSSATKRIVLYDSTLREGDQSEQINFSKEDKLLILEKLDDFGMDYVEGGWPGANPKDTAFFQEAVRLNLKQAKLAAFGMTRRPGLTASRDPGIQTILRSGVQVATLVGKTWDLHVKEALRVSYTENLRMIRDSISFLKKRLEEVFFDAEHFFDGYISNPEHAVRCIQAAEEAGADCIILCDTNGGMIPSRLQRSFARCSPSSRCLSGSMHTTTRIWRWPIRSPPSRKGWSRSRERSTGTERDAGTRTSVP